jgi:hypothetical protein
VRPPWWSWYTERYATSTGRYFLLFMAVMLFSAYSVYPDWAVVAGFLFMAGMGVLGYLYMRYVRTRLRASDPHEKGDQPSR